MGAFAKNWSDAGPATGDCAWRKEREDALRVASHLGIPFLTFDFEEEYRRGVVEYMVREYAEMHAQSGRCATKRSSSDCFRTHWPKGRMLLLPVTMPHWRARRK